VIAGHVPQIRHAARVATKRIMLPCLVVNPR
jgi:hypothetical protein